VADLRPGTTVRLDVWRDHRRREIDVKVAEAEDAVAAGPGRHPGSHGRLGLVVRPLTPEERRQAGVEGGLLVEQAEGPAARAGIQPSDVVLAVNGSKVSSVNDLRQASSRAGKHAALLVERGSVRIYIPVDLG
jgi:serine protease Do